MIKIEFYRWNGEDEVAGTGKGTRPGLVAEQSRQNPAKDAADIEQSGQISCFLAAERVAVVLQIHGQPIEERVVDELREEQAERVLEHALNDRSNNWK